MAFQYLWLRSNLTVDLVGSSRRILLNDEISHYIGYINMLFADCDLEGTPLNGDSDS